MEASLQKPSISSGGIVGLLERPSFGMKRRVCSYDMVEVPEDVYVVTDAEGEAYLCNARCLCLWAVALATKPNLPPALKTQPLTLKPGSGAELAFGSITALAKWASAHALGTDG